MPLTKSLTSKYEVRKSGGNPYHDATGAFSSKEKDAGLMNVSGWKKVGPQGGSNPGGVYRDSHGTEHYVKFPQRSPEQANAEQLADAIYRELGIPAKQSQVITDGKRTGLAGKMIPGEEKGKAHTDASQDVKSGYVADAFLANWDVFGMTYDNIKTGAADGRDYRIDNGGTMFYRAQGEGKKFPADRVDELDSLIAPGKKGHTAFAGLSQEQIKGQAANLVTRLTDERIHTLVENAGLTGDRAKLYADTLIGRRNVIGKRFGVAIKSEFLAEILRGKKPRKKLRGGQKVPMNLDAINAAMTAANS